MIGPRKFYPTPIILLFLCATALPALANSSYNLQGLFTNLQVRVLDLHKDATLIGMTKEALANTIKERLKTYHISVSGDDQKPALGLKVTTLDVGPQVVSHISLELKEFAHLPRHKRVVFITSWNTGTMVVSEPTKHEGMIKKAIGEMIDRFVRDSLD